MAKTVKDVKDKIIDYLYNIEFEKMTVAEMNALSNTTMILKSVSEIKETADEPWAKVISLLGDKDVTNNNDTCIDNHTYGNAKVGE